MTNRQISSLLVQLKSNEPYARNDAIKIIIKENINDKQIITAFNNLIENDSSMAVRNFARSALDTFGVEHSATEKEIPIINANTAHPTIGNIQNTSKSKEAIKTIDKTLFVIGAVFIAIGIVVGCLLSVFWLWMGTMH